MYENVGEGTYSYAREEEKKVKERRNEEHI